MGTSRNDRSPQTPPWMPALAVLGRADVGVDRQNAEIWRSAAADRGEMLLRDFSNPLLVEACAYLSRGIPPREALERFNKASLHASEGGLVIEMARRALVRSAASEGDPKMFVGELFAEAVSYYASRDLPSFVAARGRVPNTSSVIELKESLRRATRERVGEVGNPALDRRDWKRYISRVLRNLQTIR